MAKLRFFDNMFEDKFQEVEFDKSKTLNEQIADFSFNNAYSDYIVECYDPETGNTFYAPLDEEEGESSILITVNGVQVSENYKVEENDIVNIVYLPLAWDWRIFGTTVAGAILGGGLMFLAGFLTGGLTWGLAVPTALGILEGGMTGWLLGDTIFRNGPNTGTYEDEKTGEAQPDVRGSENQPITGNNFPFAIGKHLASPFILGDPYTEYSGEDGKDAYIRESLIVGYAPLCLTDFKLGDFWLAYNRTSTVDRDTVLNGLLKGYSTGSVTDSGDIVDIWKNNDIELEILQQHPDKPVNYGNIYPNKVVDKDVNANSLFVCDKSIIDIANITYKGTSFPNNFRTNTVQFSESCPKKITVTLNFPQGLYSSHTHTEGSEAKNIYGKIPLWFALQWRPYNRYNPSSKSDGSDVAPYNSKTEESFNNWHTDWVINNELLKTTKVYNMSAYENDLNSHLGNEFKFDAEEKNINGSTSVVDFTIERLNNLKSVTSSGEVKGVAKSTEQYFEWKNCGQTSVTMSKYSGIGYQKYIRDYSGTAIICGKRVHFMYYQLHDNIFAERKHYLCLSLKDALEEVSDNDFLTVRPLNGVRTYSINSKITLEHCNLYRNENSIVPPFEPLPDYNHFDETLTFHTDYILADFEIIQCHKADGDPASRVCGCWYNKNLYNLEPLSGRDDKHDGTKEMRVSFTREFTKEECKQFSEDPDNTINGVEVRLIRVSPNYLNQTIGTTTDSAYQYQDTIMWKSLVTEVYDENKLLKEDKLKSIPVLSESDMRKFCCISIKAKADSTGMVQQAMKKTNCMVQSFSPVWKKDNNGNYKWLPENIKKQTVYYGYFDKDGNPCNRVSGTDENPVIEKKITKVEYETGRQKGYNWIMAKEGSNFQEKMLREVLGTTQEGTGNNILDTNGRQYLETNSASGFMLACIGGQNGAVGLGYEDVNLLTLADSFDFNKDVTDGSTYTVPTVFEGNNYNKGDLAHVKFEANGYIYQGRKLEDLLKSIAISCRSVWTYDEDGKICLIPDKKQDFIQGVINQQNTISPTNTYTYSELPAGLAFNFPDENDGYEQNSVYCWDDGYSLENYHGQVENYSFDLVTNPAQIWSLGRYVLACRLLQRESLSRKIGPEGHTYSLGDIVLVQSDELLLGGGSGRVQEVITDGEKVYGVITDTPYMFKNKGEGVTVVQSKFNGISKTLTYEISAPKTIYIHELLTSEIAPKNWSYEPEDYAYKVDKEYFIFTKDTIKPYKPNKYYKVYTYSLKKGRTNLVLFKEPVDLYKGDDYSVSTEKKVDINTGDIILYGLYNQISQKYKIIKIKQDKDNTFTETLLPYFDELYNYGKPLPSFQSTVTMPAPTQDPVTLTEVQSVENRVNSNSEMMKRLEETSNVIMSSVQRLYSNHIVTLYRELKADEASIQETGITANLVYNFATNTIEWIADGDNNGWSLDYPQNPVRPVYVTSATAFGQETTDVIKPSEWARPIAVGQNGLNGLSMATITMYRRSSVKPQKPEYGGTYNFNTGDFSFRIPVENWFRSIPPLDNESNPIWETHVTALSVDAAVTDTQLIDIIEDDEWSDPVQISANIAMSKEEIEQLVKNSIEDASTPYVFTSISNMGFSINDEGYVPVNQSVTTEVHVFQYGEEVEYTWPDLDDIIPPGFRYTINGKELTLTALTGNRISKMYNISIPLIFRSIKEYYLYHETPEYGSSTSDTAVYANIYYDLLKDKPADWDDNYSAYYISVDNKPVLNTSSTWIENTYYKKVIDSGYGYIEYNEGSSEMPCNLTLQGIIGGAYLHTCSTIEEVIALQEKGLIIGDYFTWIGETTASEFAFEGQFVQRCNYTYIGGDSGYLWKKDTDASHTANTLPDVIGSAMSELDIAANEQASNYFKKVFGSEIVAKRLVAETGLISEIFSNQITIKGKNSNLGYLRGLNPQGEIGFLLDSNGHAVLNDAEVKGSITAESLLIKSGDEYKNFNDLTTEILNSKNYSTKSDIESNIVRQQMIYKVVDITLGIEMTLPTTPTNYVMPNDQSGWRTSKPTVTSKQALYSCTQYQTYEQYSNRGSTSGVANCTTPSIFGETIIDTTNGYIKTNLIKVDTLLAGYVKTDELKANYVTTNDLTTKYLNADYIHGISGVFTNVDISGSLTLPEGKSLKFASGSTIQNISVSGTTLTLVVS